MEEIRSSYIKKSDELAAKQDLNTDIASLI
jgi:hypothetical protein